MSLDLGRFYRASNPGKTIKLDDEQERKYYIDFSPVRGGRVTRELERTITLLSPDDPTTQLFTGHIGCGKSTELLWLRYELERQGFHVVYFESSQDLVMADVDVTDVLLSIARQVADSLEATNISLEPTGFKALLAGAVKLLNTEIELSAQANVPGLGEIGFDHKKGFSLGLGIGKLTAKAKNSPELRSQLRQYLEPRTDTILQAINSELLEPANQALKNNGKQGLIVIVDNLDRIDNTPKMSGRTQPEYLFVDRGEQLKQLHCHVVYTIPLVLMFSNDWSRLTNRFGVDPKVLPMVQVQNRDGSAHEPGLALLRQMILARAFPDLSPEQRLEHINEIFASPELLDRLCLINGGHVRRTLMMLYSCLQQEDPPLSATGLERVIRIQRDKLAQAINPEEWALLRQVQATRLVSGEEQHKTLLRSMFVFEYHDEQGRWFDVNPLLKEIAQ